MIADTRRDGSDRRSLDRPLILFFLVAYAIAWSLFLLMGVIAKRAGAADAATLIGLAEAYQFDGLTLPVPEIVVYLMTRLIDFSFSIAGVIMIGLTAGRDGLRTLYTRLTRFRFAGRWYALALLPLLLYAVSVLVTMLADENTRGFTLTASSIATALFSLQSGLFVSLFLRGAFGEEFGLRGFALPRLQQRMTPFRASLIIGALWGAWHLPVLLGRDPVSIILYLILVIGLTFIFTILFNGSGGSLIPPLLFHATQNWEDGFEVLAPGLVGTDWEVVSTLTLLVLGIVAGVVLWRRERGVSESGDTE